MKSDVTRYLEEKLALVLNVPSIKNIPWSSMKEGDIINWPSDVEFKRVYLMNTEEVKKLHTQVRRNQLDFSLKFLRRFKKSLSESQWRSAGQRDKLRSAVTNSLKDKLASKLNVPSIDIPWSLMEAGDIINWPSTVKFMSVWQLNVDDLKRIYELVKEDQLDISPKFLSRLGIQTQANTNDFGNIEEIPKYISFRTIKRTISEDDQIPALPSRDGIYFFIIFRLLSLSGSY
jgi:hypothetical protein